VKTFEIVWLEQRAAYCSDGQFNFCICVKCLGPQVSLTTLGGEELDPEKNLPSLWHLWFYGINVDISRQWLLPHSHWMPFCAWGDLRNPPGFAKVPGWWLFLGSIPAKQGQPTH